jgi:hypothetical protein
LIVLVVLIFGIFFVDSLGFLRLAETPVYFESAWQSPEFGVRLSIGVVHVIGALIAGVLYTSLSERYLFLWIFGIFAMVHLMYTFDLRTGTGESTVLAMPILYSLAVSLYTVVNFAIWADLSTPQNISRNTALGVAISGWMATFLSTAIALQWQERGVPVEQHLNYVDALAFVFFLAVLVLVLWPASAPAPARQPMKGKNMRPKTLALLVILLALGLAGCEGSLQRHLDRRRHAYLPRWRAFDRRNGPGIRECRHPKRRPPDRIGIYDGRQLASGGRDWRRPVADRR